MKKIYQSVLASAALLSLFAGIPAAFAHADANLGVDVSGSATVNGNGVGVGAKISADVATRIQKGQELADKEIDRRTTALNKWADRVSGAKRLTADEKSTLNASLGAQLSAMATLKAQVATDAAANSTTSLKADIKSITGSYRIFVLVLPQTAISAASDRELTIIDVMNDLGAKLQARITTAQAAGNDTTAAAAALADFNAKVSDTNVQAQAAVTEVISLTPDQGDQTKLQANTAALKDAHAKIKVGQQDLETARTDANKIIAALGTFKVSANANANVNTSAAGASY